MNYLVAVIEHYYYQTAEKDTKQSYQEVGLLFTSVFLLPFPSFVYLIMTDAHSQP